MTTPRNVKSTQPKESKAEKRWIDVLDIVCDNVAPDWKTLAVELKTSKEDIDRLCKDYPDVQMRCWNLLRKWYKESARATRSRDFLNALTRARHKRMADIVQKLLYSRGTVDEILAPHEDREVRMREAFYTVVEMAPHGWRPIARRLGLTHADIGDIEGRFKGRPREKLMEAMYKWRLLEPLQEYKVGRLIQAVKECGLLDLADQLTPYATTANVPPPKRRKRKGETILYVDCSFVDMWENQGQQKPENMPDRPKKKMSKSTLKDYTLSKIFFRLLDALEEQDRTGMHGLVQFLHAHNKAFITEISKRGSYIVVQCATREDVYDMYRMSQSNELSEYLTEFLVTEEVLREVGACRIQLHVDILESELLTVRSDSEVASLSEVSGRSVKL